MKPRFDRFHTPIPIKQALPWFAAIALLLPSVFLLQPAPVDETRYLAVAWNMHSSGQWLVPWLDGAPYSDKAPMLFWLIDLMWEVTGVHAWAARLLEMGIALATLPLLASVGRRLGLDGPARQASMWLWVGCAAMAIYADVVMFDMALTACTLAAWRATPALAGRRWATGLFALAMALGAGILVKGPVALLVGGMPALLAPWWLPSVRTRPVAFYLRLLVALAAAVLVALAWALPAARAGGTHYADAIFLRQTLGRVVKSFAHARPWWWYLPVLPLMLLPWTLSMGRGDTAAKSSSAIHDRLPGMPDRFALAAFVPCFVAFGLISGKQPHYLLPLLPALAMAAGMRLGANHWRVSAARVGLTLAIAGAAVIVGLCWLADPVHRLGAGICGVLIITMSVLYLWRSGRSLPVRVAALGMLGTLALCKLAFVLSIGNRYDVRPEASLVAAAQRQGIPLLYAGTPYGVFTFAGRLTSPIHHATSPTAILAWAAAHPHGWIISASSSYRFSPPPFYRHPYMGRSLGIWRAGLIAEKPGTMPPQKHEAISASTSDRSDCPPESTTVATCEDPPPSWIRFAG